MVLPDLIAWDAHCEIWLPKEDIGDSCPFLDYGGGNPHTLRKRRAILCPM